MEKVEKGLDDSQKRKLRKICEKSPPATPDRRDSLITDSESNYSLSVSSLAEGSIQHDVFDSSTKEIREEHPGAEKVAKSDEQDSHLLENILETFSQKEGKDELSTNRWKEEMNQEGNEMHQEEPRKGPTAGDENVTWTGQEETIVHEFGLRNQKGIHSDENQGIGNKAPIEALDSQAQLSSPPNVTEDPGGAQPVSSESTKESESYEVTQDDIKELEEKGKNIHEVRREDEKDINGDDDLGNVNEASIEALQSQAQLSSPPNEMGDLGGTQLESRETTKGSESEEDIQRVVETLNEKDRNVEEVRLGDEKDFTGDDNLGHEDETPIEALDSQDKLLSPQNIMEDLGGTQLVSSETIQESESNKAIQEDTKRLHEKDVHELRLEDEKDFNGENIGNGSEAPIETLDNQAQLSSPQTEDLGGTQPVSSEATESEEVIQQVTKRLKEKNKSFLADDRRNTFPRVKPKSSRDSLFMDMEIMRNRCQIESMRNVVETLRKLRESTQVLQEKLHGENQRLQMLRSNTHRLLF